MIEKFVSKSSAQTGPQTPEGKKAAAKNALKMGAYSPVLMPGESPQDLEDLAQGLMAQFSLECSLGLLKAQRAAMNLLQIKRVERSMAHQCLAAMDSEENRREFCARVGISESLAQELPDGYFAQNEVFRKNARFLLSVVSQAQQLHENHSAELMLKVRERFPSLWAYVMGDKPQTVRDFNFGEKLGGIYKLAHPCLNLRALIQDIEDNDAYELMWARNEERYTSALEGLKAQVMLNIQTDDKIHRALTRLHKQLDAELLWLERIAQQQKPLLVLQEQEKEQELKKGESLLIENAQ